MCKQPPAGPRLSSSRPPRAARSRRRSRDWHARSPVCCGKRLVHYATRAQLAILSARYQLPAAHARRSFVEAGGLMSYGTDVDDAIRQVGVYTGRILKGAKPADLPVVQSTKLEFAINLDTAN